MNKKNLSIISILLAGFVFSAAYGASTIITDNSITTTNLTVTGTCTGCGGVEGSFSSYNTISLNQTTGVADGSGICGALIGNDGAVLIGGSTNNKLLYLNGTLGFDHVDGNCNLIPNVAQSINGVFKIIFDVSTNKISVYKNGQFVQKLGINTSQFNIFATKSKFAISPDGHYIAITGLDSGSGTDRVVIFRGT